MSGAHLSAEELQQYVLDRAACTEENNAHLDGCPDCQAQMAAYALLMEGLRQQPAPVFGFDVSAMVMRQLAESPVVDRRAEGRTDLRVERGAEQRADRQANRRTGWGMAALILVVAGVPAWLFRRSAYYVFTDISAVFLYLILGAAVVFMLLRVLLLIKRYQQIINSINK
jgi:anti-sigma factor RsiW